MTKAFLIINTYTYPDVDFPPHIESELILSDKTKEQVTKQYWKEDFWIEVKDVTDFAKSVAEYAIDGINRQGGDANNPELAVFGHKINQVQ